MLVNKSPIVGERARWKQLKLTPIQRQKWEETKTAILFSYSGFGGILYKMMSFGANNEQAWFTDQIPTLATDDKYLYINPTFFFTLPLKQRIFGICHEVFHAMLNHCGIMYKFRRAGSIAYPDGTSLPFDDNTIQAAADCVINASLVHCHVGERIPNTYYQPYLIPHTMSMLDAYRILYKKTNGGQTLKSPSPGQGGQGQNTKDSKDLESQQPLDTHLNPGQGRGKSPQQAMAERNKVEWDSAVTSAIHTMRSMGMGSSNLEKMFGKITEPEIDWTSRLRTQFYKVAGTGRETWDFLDEEFLFRGIGAPGRLGYGAKLIIVAQDSSGSILQPMSDTFMGETSGIVNNVRPRELILVQCDDTIQEWEYVDANEDLRRKLRRGFGGTDFRPVFQRIEQENLNPDVLIYFTDCMGSYPTTPPDYPVIWGSIMPDNELRSWRPPFGEIVHIPLGKKGRNDNDD
jgi:predicted metal-dependent peptidase